jgi:hypothetical protein
MPSRYSRHYYDFYKLAESPVKDQALSNLELLEDVVAFKQRFYPSAWARYDLARPGSFRLIPNPDRVAELERDYREMAIMIFGEVPGFEAILGALRAVEAGINQRG